MCFLGLILSFSLLSGCQKSEQLILESPGQPPRTIELGSSRQFSLQYTHSVERTPVTETFQIREDGTFLLVSTRYRSYGVGLPSLPQEGRLTVADGWFVLEDLHREYRDIRLRVGPEAAVSVTYEQQSYPLHRWYPPGSLVVIRKDR